MTADVKWASVCAGAILFGTGVWMLSHNFPGLWCLVMAVAGGALFGLIFVKPKGGQS